MLSSLLDGFQLFSSTTGLVLNRRKSCLYASGVSEEVYNRLLGIGGVEKGCFPMKYLGVPLKPTKWNKFHCACIVDKFRKAISCWGTRHLSLAGRAQLVSSVLFGIRAYWMSIFLLPQSVIKAIDQLCRRFL